MKQYISKIFGIGILVLAICVTATSCRKASDNGKLDGQWQIMSIEELPSGEIKTLDQQLYICLNLHVMHLTNNEGVCCSGNMTYDKSGGKLSCDFPYDTTSESIKGLRQWGIYSNPVNFEVVELNGKKLVLKSDASIITCRRF